MQRHVKAWRSKAILTFDYKWLNDELLGEGIFKTKFQGKVIREAVLQGQYDLLMRQDGWEKTLSLMINDKVYSRPATVIIPVLISLSFL